MARSRLIRPEFFQDPIKGKLSFGALELLRGLMCFGDDCGVARYNARTILGDVFSVRADATEADVERWAKELIASRQLIHVVYDGREYLVNANWDEGDQAQIIAHPSKQAYIPPELVAQGRAAFRAGESAEKVVWASVTTTTIAAGLPATTTDSARENGAKASRDNRECVASASRVCPDAFTPNVNMNNNLNHNQNNDVVVSKKTNGERKIVDIVADLLKDRPTPKTAEERLERCKGLNTDTGDRATALMLILQKQNANSKRQIRNPAAWLRTGFTDWTPPDWALKQAREERRALAPPVAPEVKKLLRDALPSCPVGETTAAKREAALARIAKAGKQ